jgi:FkbM family methyltransferase
MVTRPNSESDNGCLREMGEDVYQLAALPTPPAVIVDIGANIGAFSVLAATMYPDCVIRAFEPERDNHTLLVRNVAAYGFQDRIQILRVAVTADRKGVSLYPGQGLSHACTVGDGCLAHPDHGTDRVWCDSVTLTDALDGLDSVDLLKVDCEGSEFEIFAGSAETLDKVRALRMEIHDYRTPADLEWLWRKLSQTFTMRVAAFVPGRGGYWFGDQ